MPLAALPVEFLFTMTANTADTPPVVIAGPSGTRVVVTAMKGTFAGPKLNGVVANVAGGDWVKVRANGVMELDVRIVLRTDDGADIFMTYTGIGVADGKGRKLRTVPRFETAAEAYLWLNDVQAVAHGTTGAGDVTYDVYGLS